MKITRDSFRNIEPRWYLLLVIAASATLGAAVASSIRRRRHHEARHREHALDVKSWENEGGNLAPIPATPVREAVTRSTLPPL